MYQSIDIGRARDLSDGDFVAAFDGLTLSPSLFGHADHVRLAFLYLREDDLFGALLRYRERLRAFATHHGAAEKVHETVTCALVALIHERMQRAPDIADWPTFAAANPDLTTWEDGVFFDYYDRDILDCPVARRTFVLPRPRAGTASPAGGLRVGNPRASAP